MKEELLMKHNMHRKPGLHVVSGYTVRPGFPGVNGACPLGKGVNFTVTLD